MNLQRREEIRKMCAGPARGGTQGAKQIYDLRDAVTEAFAHIDALEQAAAERVIAEGSRGPGVAPAVAVPESLLHDLALAAWDEGADAGMAWDPDADPAKRGVVPRTPEEGIAKARDHFAKHGSGSPSSAFSRALQAIREHSRSIPADRVLGEGMVAVDRAKLAQLIAEVDDALDRYESGNPIQAGELYSAFEALRANQGGVAT